MDMPSNEGRGYVLRENYASSHASCAPIGQQRATFYKRLVPSFAEMGANYPELVRESP